MVFKKKLLSKSIAYKMEEPTAGTTPGWIAQRTLVCASEFIKG